jgi:hypothetical protein
MMNITDKTSIFIVFVFYLATLGGGYLLKSRHDNIQIDPAERLILSIPGNRIDAQLKTLVVIEDSGIAPPVEKVLSLGSIGAVLSFYEKKEYHLDHVTEFPQVMNGEEVWLTRLWLTKD